jgi:hypothetical protein
VNMKTGIAHIVSDASQRAQGLIMPNTTQTDPGLGLGGKPAAKAPPP